MDSKLESERVKRPGILLQQESSKRIKIVEASETEPLQEQQAKDPKDLSEEELKKMMEIVPMEEVDLKRLYEPDPQDQLWEQLKYMHDPLEWKLYDTCEVHHVFIGRGQEIFMLVEKDYPLTKGLATVMLCNKLQVDQYLEMANALMAFSLLVVRFPLLEGFPTASLNMPLQSFYCLKNFPLLVDEKEFGIEIDSNKSTNKGSKSTGEMANVLSSMGAANILASGGLKEFVTTASPQFSPASLQVAPASATDAPTVATASTRIPTVVTSVTTRPTKTYTRRARVSRGVVIESSQPSHTTSTPTFSTKGKEKMTEPEKPSKKRVQEQMSEQLARQLEEEFAQENQAIREQVARDAEIAKIQAEEDLRQMIDELDRSNEVVNKHMAEYEQAEQDLSLEEKIDLIKVLLNYQKNLAQVKKYQAQQQKLGSKTERRKFYISVLKSHAGWKVKDFKGMTFEQIEEAFIPVWESIQDFVPMDSKLESERVKRPGILLQQESSKRMKTVTDPSQEQQAKVPEGLSEEELKKMMEIVPVEEVYIEVLQIKRPIIAWEVYSGEGRESWKITRVGNYTEIHQTFEDMLKKVDREDLDKIREVMAKFLEWSSGQATWSGGQDGGVVPKGL
ncbi:hypothetical protein Tco_1335210 [Tanacetum coccineum]